MPVYNSIYSGLNKQHRIELIGIAYSKLTECVHIQMWKAAITILFEDYPAAMDVVTQFGVKTLTTLTVESMGWIVP